MTSPENRPGSTPGAGAPCVWTPEARTFFSLEEGAHKNTTEEKVWTPEVRTFFSLEEGAHKNTAEEKDTKVESEMMQSVGAATHSAPVGIGDWASSLSPPFMSPRAATPNALSGEPTVRGEDPMRRYHAALPQKYRDTPEWTSGLFDVCSGGRNRCLYTFACAPCMFGYVAERVPPGGGYLNNCLLFLQTASFSWMPCCCCCRVPTALLGSLVVTDMRQRLRRTYNLPEDPACSFGDDCAAQCCAPCMLIQMANQVDTVARDNDGVYPMTHGDRQIGGDGYCLYPSYEYFLYPSTSTHASRRPSGTPDAFAEALLAPDQRLFMTRP